MDGASRPFIVGCHNQHKRYLDAHEVAALNSAFHHHIGLLLLVPSHGTTAE